MPRKPAQSAKPRRVTRQIYGDPADDHEEPRRGRRPIPPFERFTDDAAMVASLILYERAGMDTLKAMDIVASEYAVSVSDVDRAAYTERSGSQSYKAILGEYLYDDLRALVDEQRRIAKHEALASGPQPWRRKRPRS